MSSPRFLTSRIFLIQIAIAAAIILALVFLTLKGLELYTRHGQSNPVPDFSGMSKTEAMKVASHNNMRIEIIDSVFVEDAAPGVIVDQLPEAGHGIKQDRTIFVSINSTLPEMVTVPQLTDISFRQAQVLIENSGLQVGQIMYRPSQFTNLVLEVQIDSQIVRPGQKIPKNSNIDLVIGRTQGNTTTPLPDLTGLTLEESEEILINSMLNTGVVIYDNSIVADVDSVEARVWRQRPSPDNISSVLLGSFIDLWMTTDTLKIFKKNEADF
jgi:beta-lactam-binding protein with PASTA domain